VLRQPGNRLVNIMVAPAVVVAPLSGSTASKSGSSDDKCLDSLFNIPIGSVSKRREAFNGSVMVKSCEENSGKREREKCNKQLLNDYSTEAEITADVPLVIDGYSMAAEKIKLTSCQKRHRKKRLEKAAALIAISTNTSTQS
jgi:hypothetical protein